MTFNIAVQMSLIGYRLDQCRFERHFLVSIVAALLGTYCNIFVCMSPVLLYNQTNVMGDWIYALLLIIMLSTQLSLLFLYSYFLLSIRIRFRLLNKALGKAFVPAVGAKLLRLSLNDRGASEVILFANRLSILHYQLTAAVRIINRCLSFQVSLLCIHLKSYYMPKLYLHLYLYLLIRSWWIWRSVFRCAFVVLSWSIQFWLRICILLNTLYRLRYGFCSTHCISRQQYTWLTPPVKRYTSNNTIKSKFIWQKSIYSRGEQPSIS